MIVALLVPLLAASVAAAPPNAKPSNAAASPSDRAANGPPSADLIEFLGEFGDEDDATLDALGFASENADPAATPAANDKTTPRRPKRPQPMKQGQQQ